MHHRGLRKSSSAEHKVPRQARMKFPDPAAVVPSISLVNIDDDVMGVFDSLIGLGGHESSYSVLPGKNKAPLLLQNRQVFLLISNEIYQLMKTLL